MGRAIVKQPNGKLAVFSTIVDDFVYLDCEWEDYIQFRLKEAEEDIRREVERAKEEVAKRGTTSMWDRTWESCLNEIELHHGAEKAQERRETGEAT